MLALILLVAAATSVAAIVRNRSPGFGLVTMVAVVVLYGGLWWLWSLRLPPRPASPFELIPGAIAFAVGVEVLHLFVVYYLAARLTHASALYGSLGIAAALLFGLYLVGRLIVAAIVINVAVCGNTAIAGGGAGGPRRGRGAGSPAAGSPDAGVARGGVHPGARLARSDRVACVRCGRADAALHGASRVGDHGRVSRFRAG